MWRYTIAIVLLLDTLAHALCWCLTQNRIVLSRNTLVSVGPSSKMKCPASIAASISEQDRFDGSNDLQQALSTSVGYIESLTQSASDIIQETLLEEEEEEFTSSNSMKTKRQVQSSRLVLDVDTQKRYYRFDITLPTSSTDISSSAGIGLAVRRMSHDGIISDTALDFDTLSFISLEDEKFRTPKMAGIRSVKGDTADSDFGVVELLTDMEKMKGGTPGLFVSSVVRGGLAWKAGIRAGDCLVATSATMGDKMWPKSTLDGVRSAISSRKLLSPSIQVRFERPVETLIGDVMVEEFELTLRPIGITIENDKDTGSVKVSGFSDQASNELKACLRVGDRIIAVESSLGRNMWPVSNVEGVISACTSRLPGLPIKMRFERTLSTHGNIEPISPSSLSIPGKDMSPSFIIPKYSFTNEAKKMLNTVDTPVEVTSDQKSLLKKVRGLLRRYRAVHDPSVNKSSKVLILVTERAVDTLMAAAISLDAKTLLLIMDSFTMSGKPSGAIKVFEAAVGLSSDGSTSKISSVFSDSKSPRTLIPESNCLNVYTGTALLRAHALSGDYNAARRVLAAMEGDILEVNGVQSIKWPGNIKPDTNCYNTVIYAAANAGASEALDMAKSLYDTMAEPVLFPTARPKRTLITYNTMISAYARYGRRQEAFSIFTKMKDAGINPDRISVTSLIKAAIEDGDLRAGKALLRDMRKAGIEADVVTYNTLIKGYCDRNQMFEAKELVLEMETRGIRPDAKTYSFLMNALLKARKPGPCLTLFESACADERTVAITENVQLYTTAVTAAASMGDFDRALDLISRMSFSGVKPNIKTLTALMSASLSAGKFDYALDVYGKISNPDGLATTLALKAFCDKGDYDRVLDILRSQRSSNHEMSGKQIMSIYNYFLEKSLAYSHYNIALDGMNDLLSAGFIPSVQIFKTINSALRFEQPRRNLGVLKGSSLDEVNKFEFLLSVLDALERRKLYLDYETYIIIIKEGNRHGGIRRKIASLIAKARSKSGPSGKSLSESSDDKIKPVDITWVDLLKHFSQYKSHVERNDLPLVRIRCNDRELRQILVAEQSLTARTRI